ncbi:MAG TPA: hypothetical protein VGR73_17095 [Bryobacteraceae bacterium]|nr:hypothetical protein [Bryobacteraceae bacterium]
MILPASYLSGLLVMIAALLCAGSWASTFKAAGRWRYEIYYFDFSIGVLLCALIAALTLGSMRSSELTFQDNFLIASYRKLVYAVAAGLIFNLGNVLLLAGISVGGLALCAPLAFGIALVIDLSWDFILDPRSNVLLLFGGVLVALVAILLIAVAYLQFRAGMQEASRKAALQLDPRSKEARRRPRRTAAGVGIALGIVSGVILSFAPRVLDLAREGENGVAPYGLTLLFAAGVLLSTLIYSPFVINFPIGGIATGVADYFRGTVRQHLLGILGGILLAASAVAANAVIGSPAAVLIGPAVVRGLEQGAPLVAMLWGLLVWNEFSNAGDRVKTFLWGGFLLYAVGVAMMALAPLYGSK